MSRRACPYWTQRPSFPVRCLPFLAKMGVPFRNTSRGGPQCLRGRYTIVRLSFPASPLFNVSTHFFAPRGETTCVGTGLWLIAARCWLIQAHVACAEWAVNQTAVQGFNWIAVQDQYGEIIRKLHVLAEGSVIVPFEDWRCTFWQVNPNCCSKFTFFLDDCSPLCPARRLWGGRFVVKEYQ